VVSLPLENLDGLAVAARKISRSPPHDRSQRLAPLQKTGVSGQKLSNECPIRRSPYDMKYCVKIAFRHYHELPSANNAPAVL
jgi:hypothetical protein